MKPIILDVDFDFFFNSEKTILEDPFKTYWINPLEFFERHAWGVSPKAVCCHSEVLGHWDREGIRNAVCYHFDAHHDVWDYAYDLENLPVGSRLDYITPGNYLFFALREGIIDQAVLILPDWQDAEYWAHELRMAVRGLGPRIQVIRYRDFINTHAHQGPIATHAFCALSPEFTPSDCFEDFNECCCPYPEVMEQGRLIQRDFVVGRPQQGGFRYFYDGTLELDESRASLYHGSSMGGLSVLRPEKSTHRLFASPSPAFASCFGLPLCDASGWVHGVEFLACEKPFVYLLVPKKEERLLHSPMSLYRMDNSNRFFIPDGKIAGYEYSCEVELPVSMEMPFSSVKLALDKFSVRAFVEGKNAITDSVILRLTREHTEEVEHYFEMPMNSILSLPFFTHQLYLYFVGKGTADLSLFSRHYSPIWLNFLDRRIMPLAFAYAINPSSSYHGLSHAWLVAYQALALALEKGENPLPVLLASAFHDIARVGDAEEEEHAPASAALARVIMENHFKDSLTAEDEERVEKAIRNHAMGFRGENLVESLLWDSDRIRLGWERGFDERYFSTDTARQFVLNGETFTRNHQEHIFRKRIFELKIEVTSRCNLSCSFCHQRSDVRKMGHDLSLDTCKAYLDQCVSSDIHMVRFTGGEPFVRQDAHQFFLAAKQRDLFVTVNTNGLITDQDSIEKCVGLVDCFKLSFPAATSEEMASATYNGKAWEQKLEALALFIAYGFRVELLTIMTPSNVEAFDTFIELIEPLEGVRWLPLRPEPNTVNRRPVGRLDVQLLAGKIARQKMEKERWSDLKLNLAVPFCVLDDPAAASYVFTGRADCGPISSLTLSPEGFLISCYSDRNPLPRLENLQSSALESPQYPLTSLPRVCQLCPYAFTCLGGCRCPQVLEETPYGWIDYLAQPWVLEGMEK